MWQALERLSQGAGCRLCHLCCWAHLVLCHLTELLSTMFLVCCSVATLSTGTSGSQVENTLVCGLQSKGLQFNLNGNNQGITMFAPINNAFSAPLLAVRQDHYLQSDSYVCQSHANTILGAPCACPPFPWQVRISRPLFCSTACTHSCHTAPPSTSTTTLLSNQASDRCQLFCVLPARLQCCTRTSQHAADSTKEGTKHNVTPHTAC